ncbi:MAG: carboxylate-amine ligase [Bacillota bacterium]
MAISQWELSGQAFEEASDLTVGIEEEIQLLEPQTLSLTNRYQDLISLAPENLREHLKGELIASEIEIATRKCYTMQEAAEDLKARRQQLTELALGRGIWLAATGTHPFSPWWEQQVIDTPHYRLVEQDLGYAAWRNNTFSFHLHLGVKGKDRAVKLADALRSFLPSFLALSASSPFAEGVLTRLHSTRTQLFTKNFPRCGIPDAYGSWESYRTYLEFLIQSNSIHDTSQIWWSIRPHVKLGTVEIRICDAQPRLEDTIGISSLILAVAAKTLQLIDSGKALTSHPHRLLEENCWRATRYGLAGNLVDLESWREQPAPVVIEKLMDWCNGIAQGLGLEGYFHGLWNMLRHGNSAIHQIGLHQQGMPLREIHRRNASTTMGQPLEMVQEPPVLQPQMWQVQPSPHPIESWGFVND